jgi:hypothetical protein
MAAMNPGGCVGEGVGVQRDFGLSSSESMPLGAAAGADMAFVEKGDAGSTEDGDD